VAHLFPSSYKLKRGFEPTSEDYGSDREISAFTTRPEVFPVALVVNVVLLLLFANPSIKYFKWSAHWKSLGTTVLDVQSDASDAQTFLP